MGCGISLQRTWHQLPALPRFCKEKENVSTLTYEKHLLQLSVLDETSSSIYSSALAKTGEDGDKARRAHKSSSGIFFMRSEGLLRKSMITREKLEIKGSAHNNSLMSRFARSCEICDFSCAYEKSQQSQGRRFFAFACDFSQFLVLLTI